MFIGGKLSYAIDTIPNEDMKIIGVTLIERNKLDKDNETLISQFEKIRNTTYETGYSPYAGIFVTNEQICVVHQFYDTNLKAALEETNEKSIYKNPLWKLYVVHFFVTSNCLYSYEDYLLDPEDVFIVDKIDIFVDPTLNPKNKYLPTCITKTKGFYKKVNRTLLVAAQTILGEIPGFKTLQSDTDDVFWGKYIVFCQNLIDDSVVSDGNTAFCLNFVKLPEEHSDHSTEGHESLIEKLKEYILTMLQAYVNKKYPELFESCGELVQKAEYKEFYQIWNVLDRKSLYNGNSPLKENFKTFIADMFKKRGELKLI